jgi:hypothetical protein
MTLNRRFGLLFAFLMIVGVSNVYGKGSNNDGLTIEQLKKTVLFIEHYDNSNKLDYIATGFLIGVPLPDNKDAITLLLVTNRHVLEHLDPSTNTVKFFDKVVLSINLKSPTPDGKLIYRYDYTLMINGYNRCATNSNDPDSDIVICPLEFADAFDIKALSTSNFMTDDLAISTHLNETDDVLFSGLFLSYRGAIKNYPIVRHGKIALINNEKLPMQINGKNTYQDAYLVELTSYPGNSGSPVFVRYSGIRETGETESVKYYLLGVMEGFESAKRPITLINQNYPPVTLESYDNSGIAIVVKSEKINEIIEQKKIKANLLQKSCDAFSLSGKYDQAESECVKGIQLIEHDATERMLLTFIRSSYALLLAKEKRYKESNDQMKMITDSLER